MIRFHRAFILATLLGVGGGFLFQWATRGRPAVPREPPTTQTLPVPEPYGEETTVRGRLLTPAGAPAAGGAVVASTDRWVRSDTIDGEGRFQLELPATDEVQFDLLLHGHRPRAERATLPLDGPVLWRTGEPYPEVAALPPLERAPLAGRLVPRPERGALGFEVWLRPAGDSSEAVLAGVVERRAEVDLLGFFRFEGLALGRYELIVLPPFARGADWPGLVRLSIEHDGEREPLEVRYASSTLVGRVLDTKGAPVEGALIEVRSVRDLDRLWPLTRAAADGTFRVPYLVDGNYRVGVRAGGAAIEQNVRVLRDHEQTIELPPLELATAD